MAIRSYGSSSNTYYTPPSMYQILLDFMCIEEFTTDIAADNTNVPAVLYRTIDGEYRRDEFNPLFKVSNRDGLAGDFGNGVHFCNPPFNKTREFLKVINSEIQKNPKSRFWCIIPSDRFETKYYWEYVLRNPYCFWVAMTKQGFLVPERPLAKPIPSVKVMYAYFGLDAYETAKSFHEIYGDFYTVVYNNLYHNSL